MEIATKTKIKHLTKKTDIDVGIITTVTVTIVNHSAANTIEESCCILLHNLNVQAVDHCSS